MSLDAHREALADMIRTVESMPGMADQDRRRVAAHLRENLTPELLARIETLAERMRVPLHRAFSETLALGLAEPSRVVFFNAWANAVGRELGVLFRTWWRAGLRENPASMLMVWTVMIREALEEETK